MTLKNTGGSLDKIFIAPKRELTTPMPSDGIARAIALFDFNAVQSGDLSFNKGQIITITEKSDETNTWSAEGTITSAASRY